MPTRRARGRPPARAPGRASSRQGAEAGSRADHPAHLRPPKQPTAAPHHLRRHLFHRFLRLPHRRVSFALESFSRFSLLPLPTLLQSPVARLLAHFLTYYGRGIQPSSEKHHKTGSIYDNTARPTPIWRRFPACPSPTAAPPLEAWARLLPAPSTSAPPPPPWSPGGSRSPAHTEGQTLGLETRKGWSVWSVLSANCQYRQTAWKVKWNVFLAFSKERLYHIFKKILQLCVANTVLTFPLSHIFRHNHIINLLVD